MFLTGCGYYLIHASNVTFTNCFTSAALTDAWPWIGTNDVSKLTSGQTWPTAPTLRRCPADEDSLFWQTVSPMCRVVGGEAVFAADSWVSRA
jgi:hypothetical protein